MLKNGLFGLVVPRADKYLGGTDAGRICRGADLQQTFAIIAKPSPEALDTVININMNISRGSVRFRPTAWTRACFTFSPVCGNTPA